MKTKLFFTSVLAITMVIQMNAQIRVFSNGTIALGGTSVPAGNSLSINFNQFRFGAANAGKPTVSWDLTPSDPRIWSSSAKIVLYNTSSGIYNDFEIRTLYTHSDESSKVNIATLTDALNTVKMLRGVSYNWKQQISEIDKKKNYGFIAQEVEQIIPDVTITDSLGRKSLNYIAIIPYLVEAVKDLSGQVESLEKQLAESSAGPEFKSTDKSISGDALTATLYQNTPNPFSQNTEIRYYLPTSAGKSLLNIYDMNGLQIKSISITMYGEGSVTINGSELRPGMYLYALIIDGKEIATKRMILTD